MRATFSACVAAARAVGGRPRRRRPIVTAGAGAALMATLALGTATFAHGQTTPSRPACFGAAAHDYLHPCSNSTLRFKTTPTPDDATIEPNSDCTPISLTARPFVCTFGFTSAAGAPPVDTIALVGDSHAAHWRAALGPVAVQKQWAGVSLTRSSCPFSTTTPVLERDTKRACLQWNPQVQAWLRRHKQVSTMFISEHIQVRVEDSKGRGQFEAKVHGYMNQWKQLPASIKHVVVIKDTPRATGKTAQCVTRALAAKKQPGRVCAIARGFAVKPDPAVEAVRRLHSPRYLSVDLTSFFCSSRFCPPVIGGALVFKDPGHITRVYGETLAPYLLRAVEALDPFKPAPEPAPATAPTNTP